MMKFRDFMLQEEVSRQDLAMLKQYMSRQFEKSRMDFDFSKHFWDRVNDARNKPEITRKELLDIFTTVYERHKDKLKHLKPETEAIIKDVKTTITIPFVIKQRKDKTFVPMTIMRKKDFKTMDRVYKT